MVLGLENRGLIERMPGMARSIRLLVPPAELPPLEEPPDNGWAGRRTNGIWTPPVKWIA